MAMGLSGLPSKAIRRAGAHVTKNNGGKVWEDQRWAERGPEDGTPSLCQWKSSRGSNNICRCPRTRDEKKEKGEVRGLTALAYLYSGVVL